MTRQPTTIITLLLASVCAAAMPQTAATAGGRDTAQTRPATVYTRDATAEANAAALIERARTSRHGRIRVIVGLDLAMHDENTLSAAAQAIQSRALASLQNEVLRRSLPGVRAGQVVRFDLIPFMSVTVTAAQLRRLIADPAVVSITQDIPARPLLSESTKKIQANLLWKKRINGNGMAIAVLDTGVDLNHNALVDKVVQGACFSTNDLPDEESMCPGGAARKISVAAGRHCPLNLDGCEHGTHVASIAAGSSLDLRGVAFRSDIISMMVFTKFTDPTVCGSRPAPCISSNTTDQIQALQWVLRWHNRAAFKIAAANLSFGKEYFNNCDAWEPSMTAIITKLRRAGIPTIAAAGNDGRNGQIVYPACISDAIAVGSSTLSDRIAVDSNHGPQVKLVAPGALIKAAKAGTRNGTTVISGTSQAAPHVAGAFALLRQAAPRATMNEILAALECTGVPVKRRGDYDLKKPRIQLLEALRYLRRSSDEVERWDFNRPRDADDWKVLSGGDWEINRGHWKLAQYRPGRNITWRPYCHGAVEIVADVQDINRNSAATFSAQNVRLLFKVAVDEQTRELVGGYYVRYFWSPSEPYVYTTVRRIVRAGGIYASLGCDKRLSKAALNINGHNRIKVRSIGDKHRFFLNGKLVCTATDSTHQSGAVGFWVDDGGASNAERRKMAFRINWVRITPLSEDPAPAAAKATDPVVHPEMYRRSATAQDATLPR